MSTTSPRVRYVLDRLAELSEGRTIAWESPYQGLVRANGRADAATYGPVGPLALAAEILGGAPSSTDDTAIDDVDRHLADRLGQTDAWAIACGIEDEVRGRAAEGSPYADQQAYHYTRAVVRGVAARRHGRTERPASRRVARTGF